MRNRFTIPDRTFGLLLTIPAFAVLGMVMVFPLLRVVQLSVNDYKVFEGGRLVFVGLKNYREAFQDPRFYNAVVNTLLFTLITVTFQMFFGMLIALILDREFRGRWIMRMAILLPWALPNVVNALLFRWMFDGQFGLFNDILLRLGIVREPVTWLVTPAGASFAIYFTQIWKVSSLVGLILLAGLQSIPREIYESARVDGAGDWKQFFRLTLPLLRPAIIVALIFRSLVALQVFDVIYAMTKGGPGDATESLVYNIWMHIFAYNEFGYGSALSVLLSILILAFGFLYIRGFYRNESVMGEGAR
jgi:multiple sugar transport system permease protein